MKTTKLFLTLSLVLFVSSISFGQISGSAHDFNGKAWNTTGEICVVCHTPHNADITVADAPLWNHEVTTATFTLYTSGTLDATTGQPDGSSKLCLSCHDGTVPMDSFGGATGNNSIGGGALVGTDLSNDHPISFTYDATLAAADGELFDPTVATVAGGGTIDNDLLISGKMQCSSCHDVHNSTNINGLLVVSNAGSALCLTCHNK